MADELDENYQLEKKFKIKAADLDEFSDSNEQSFQLNKKSKFEQTRASNESNNKKIKKKKKNITEILELKKNDLNKPSYASNEFKNSLKKFINENLSSVEKNEFNLHEDLDTKLDELIVKRTQVSKLQFEQQFESFFSSKLNNYLEKESSQKKKKPFVIILCSSAIRCIELQKKLDSSIDLIKSKKIKWMHAFAKHKKLNEQIDFIEKCKTPIHLIYATPQRLAQLVEAGALNLNLLKYVVMDYMFRDCKLKRFIDMPDLRDEFFKLTHKYLFSLNKEKIKFKFYLA